MATPPRAAGEARPSLVRAIGRFDLTAAVVNGVIGSGIFGMPAILAGLTGALSPLACLAAGAGVLTIVLCFAEVASRFREPGGPYLYVREAFGPGLGFQAGWLTLWVRLTAIAANLNIFVEYLARLLPAAGGPNGRLLTMAAVVVPITVLNLLGVRQAAWAVDAFTVAKLAPLLLLILIGLPAIRAETLATQAVPAPDWTHAILLLMFAYGGFESPLIPAGEARDPRRDSAFALLVAMAVVAGVYMLVQLVIVGALPHAAEAKAPVAAAFARLIGPAGVVLASLGAMVSVWGYSLGNVLQGPRLLYSMAERGELPAVLARIHPRFRTPDVAIVAFAAGVYALAAAGTFESAATLSAIIRLVTYGLTCAAVPVLRRRGSVEAAAFRIPAAGLVALFAVLFCLGLLVDHSYAKVWVERSFALLLVLPVLMVLGWALKAVTTRRR